LLLGSRIALGVYVPAVSLKKELESRGDTADIICMEDLYEGRESVMEETKRSFHQDFRLAEISYRMPTRNVAAMDEEATTGLLERLASEKYDAVITFSGFWAGFLNELAAYCPHYGDRLYAVHMDAGYSLSWKNTAPGLIKEIWLFNLERKTAEHLLESPDLAEKACDEKDLSKRRILVHGGGWGIGEYQTKISQLNELGYSLDIMLYYPEEIDAYKSGAASDNLNDYYLLDPKWKADANGAEFPRILKYESDSWNELGDNSKGNPLRILMKRAAAVLSKPGGGTLSDSLVTVTPLIFAEELASYEGENKALWTEKGFGIGFDSFVQAASRDFGSAEASDEMLKEMRKRLLDAQQGLTRVSEII